MGRFTVVLLVALVGCQRERGQAPPQKEVTRSSPEASALPARNKSADLVPVKEGAIADWPKPAVALVLTGQQLGYIEPCGCTGLENQKGGLARRHTLIRQLADERGWPVVPLDVGSQVKRFGKQEEIKFAHIVQGLRTIGFRAVTLGEGDLRLTPGELLAAMA